MHKSKGNSIEPDEIIKQGGADLLRLWTASVEFTEDVTLSKTILDRLTEAYRKLRNTFRYALGNLADFDPAVDSVPAAEMLEIDRWILSRAEEVVRQCRQSYKELAFHKVYRAIYDFAATDLSAVYFDVLKDRLYTAGTRSRARRSGQTALYKIHYALTRLIAPLLSFTAEEVWGYTAKPAGAPESVHMALLPEPEELAGGLEGASLEKWNRLMTVRETVLKALEESRQAKVIGAPLEARVRLQGFAELERVRRRSARLVHRVASRSRAWRGPEIDCRRTSRRNEVRTLLEIRDDGRQQCNVSDSLRCLRSRPSRRRGKVVSAVGPPLMAASRPSAGFLSVHQQASLKTGCPHKCRPHTK